MGLDFDIFIETFTSVFMKRLACVWPSCPSQVFLSRPRLTKYSWDSFGVKHEIFFLHIFYFFGVSFFFQIALCMNFHFLNSLPEILQTTFATGANPFSASLCWQRGLYGLSYGT